MKLNNIKHVFFDLDHTLWDFDKNSALTFATIFKLNNIKIEIDDFLTEYEPINFRYWKLYREAKIDKSRLRYGRLKDSFDRIGLAMDDVVINKLSIDYIEYLTTNNHLFAGAIEVLEYLYKNYKLHIITNGFEEAQYRKMKNSNIAHYFETITNSEMVGVKKPNKRIFQFALQNAGALPDESVMIGDNFEADIMGAQNVEMETIHFNYLKEKPREKVKTIDSLSQIKNYL